MPLNVTIHPNRISITPHRLPKNNTDQYKAGYQENTSNYTIHQNSLANLQIAKNPFIISKASKKRLRDRILGMYRLSTPRTEKTENGKLLYNFKCSFLTLTLPSKQIHSDKEIKELCLNQLFIELRKYYKVENYVWKAELQASGNIHFHIITDRYLSYYAVRFRWNRILEKLGYVSRYIDKMLAMSFEEYFEMRRKYNKNLSKIEALIIWKKRTAENWKNPNSVDIKRVRNDKEIAIYLSKYMTKEPIKDYEDLSKEDIKMLERGREFGRSWFCSRSLSRLKTSFNITLSKASDIIHEVVSKDSTFTIQDFFYTVHFYRFEELALDFRLWMRGWLIANAIECCYNYP